MALKVIIAGGRTFNDFDLLCKTCDKAFSLQNEIEIVSGRCSTGSLTFTTKEGINVFGADGLGELYAENKGFKVTPFPADWSNFGKRAGNIRNKEMAIYADALIAFWDGQSKGTKNMIDLAKSYALKFKVVLYHQSN